MATDLQEIRYSITAADGASATFKRVRGAMGEVERGYSQLLRTFGGIVGGGAVASVFTAMVNEAKEAEVQSVRLSAVLRATGYAAGLTKGELDGMADSLAEISQFDDEGIRSGMATFLKFGNIQKGVFEEGLALAADYAAFLGTDFPAASQAIGRALNSPTQGLRALQQELGRMTPEQERSIQKFMEQGKVIEAQGVVLDFLRGKIKGTAQEMNSGFTGALASVAKSFGELMESIGKSAVGEAAKSFLTFLAQSMRDIKNIVDNGDWVEKLKNISLFMLGFRGMDSTPRNTGGASGSWATPGPMPKTEEQLKKAADATKKLDDERKELLKAGQASDEAAMAARYDAANEMYIADGQRALKAINERRDLEEQIRRDDEAAWKAYYDDLAEQRDEFVAREGEVILAQQATQREAEQRSVERHAASLREMSEFQREAARSMQSTMSTYFYDVLERRNTSFSESFRQMLNRMQADLLASKLSGFLFGNLGKTGEIGGLLGTGLDRLFGASGAAAADSAQFGIPAPSFGFATGGSFTVGGGGGTDTTPVSFMATRGERVTVETPDQQRRGGSIVQNITVGGNVSQADIPNILAAAKQGALAAYAEQQRRGQR